MHSTLVNLADKGLKRLLTLILNIIQKWCSSGIGTRISPYGVKNKKQRLSEHSVAGNILLILEVRGKWPDSRFKLQEAMNDSKLAYRII